jgi:hypothetical protein
MFEILNTAGRTMELPADQEVNIEKFNPLFNDPEKFYQDISYPGNAPMSPSNKLFFQGGHLVDSDNSVYEMAVQVNFGGNLFFSGNLSYSINKNSFEFTLKPNFSAIASMVKSGKLTDVQTMDADYISGVTVAGFEALMLASCTHPERYPFAFLPVYNLKLGDVPPEGTYKFVNYFDYAAQVFKAKEPGGSAFSFDTAECPYYKLTYIISNVIKALGYRPAGGFFSNPANNKLYVYTRKGIHMNLAPKELLPSMYYMPYIALDKFLKDMRERLHLAFDFNLATGEVEVENFKSILEGDRLLDLSPFIEGISELSRPKQRGYKVSLKSDEMDENFAVEKDDQTSYPPIYELKVGEAESDIPLECSTLKAETPTSGTYAGMKYCSALQQVFKYGLLTRRNFEYEDIKQPGSLKVGRLRLIRYNGMKQMAPGKYWPETEPVDLDNDDIQWYRFQNDCKQITISANIPPATLAQLKLTGKYSATTREGTYFEFIIERISYRLMATHDMVPVEIYARTINNSITTKASIEKLVNPDDATGLPPYTRGVVKAYFNLDKHNISELQVEVMSTTPLEAQHRIFNVETIKVPTDEHGFGGLPYWFTQPTGLYEGTAEFRIRQGKPKYLYYIGKKYTFTKTGDYYSAIVDINGVLEIYSTYWIVF